MTKSIEYSGNQLPQPSIIPTPTRPIVKDYGIPEDEEGLLNWDFVDERMANARNYWVATVEVNGRPHTVPVWGIWRNNILYFGGGPDTRWSRNVAQNQEVVVHLESGDEVVIFEGSVQRIQDAELMAPIDDLYEEKYKIRHGPPIWILTPRVVFAWGTYPTTTTRWLFGT